MSYKRNRNRMEINFIGIIRVIKEMKVVTNLKAWLFVNHRIQVYLISYRDRLYLYNLHLYNLSQDIEEKLPQKIEN